jgi:predicted GNAT family acetyltransferase
MAPIAQLERAAQKARGGIHDNVELDRFELDLDEGTAVAYYRLTPDAIHLIHTEVPAAMRNQGVGSELIRSALEWSRARGLKVVAECPFVRAFLDRHPEFADLARR